MSSFISVDLLFSFFSEHILPAISKCRRLKIYVKFTGSLLTDSLSSLGYIELAHNAGMSFHVLLSLDIENRSNTSKIIRNISLFAYKGNTFIAQFKQCQGNSKNPNEAGAIVLGDNGAYSTTISPNSTKRLHLEFLLKQKDLISGINQFNKIYLAYYDENDNLISYYLLDVESNWIEGTLASPKQWILLNESRRVLLNDKRLKDELS